MKVNRRQLLKTLQACGALLAAAVPMMIQLAGFLYLPTFHRGARYVLAEEWTYRIADSGVTVGLAYYALLLFVIWQTRWLGWKGGQYVMDLFKEVIEEGFERAFWKAEEPPRKFERLTPKPQSEGGGAGDDFELFL